jgi:3-methyl-2-oxobutanoate hydroxymethyltransferase
MKRTTVRDILSRYRDGKKIVSLSLYDAWMAKLADEMGADILLVGDSLGMTVLGYDSTVPVTIEDCIRHTGAVVRGSSVALVVGDMPFGSYQGSFETALKNAARFLQEAGANAVKLEGAGPVVKTIEGFVRSGIPVMGHIGILPQNFHVDGYRVKGKTKAEAEALLQDALDLQEAGVFSIVIEGVTAKVAKEISENLSIPTIGIGAGLGCDGQIQVAHDILGLMEGFVPKHAKVYAQISHTIRQAFGQYVDEVRSGSFPGEENSFK